MKELTIFCTLLIFLNSCGKETENLPKNSPREFDDSILRSDYSPTKLVRGQLLYMPVYSNVPYQLDTMLFDMSAFVAIHNVDIKHPIFLSNVLYFDQEGRLVDDFLKGQNIKLEPLATKDFYIPYEDKSGTGANFLIEWTSDTLVCEPLVESITLSLKPNNTVAVISQGKIIKEKL
jgi:hypothetical protein